MDMKNIALAASLLVSFQAAEAVTCSDSTSWTNDRFTTLVAKGLNVVEGARATGLGAWSFGGLMTKLGNGHTGGSGKFVEDFFMLWSTDQILNGEPAPRVQNMKPIFLDAWPRVSGNLDLSQSPFRLLAIVNRADRYDVAAGHAGELRFVYGAFETAALYPNRRLPLKFTITLEFRVKKVDGVNVTSMTQVKAWARKWAALYGSGANYVSSLQAITDQVVGTVALAQANIENVRTNEQSIDDPWDLRSFYLANNATGYTLVAEPLSMTPNVSQEDNASLATWINNNATAILLHKHRLPNGTTEPKAAAFAPMTKIRRFGTMATTTSQEFHWDVPGVAATTMRAFSRGTCNGCHAGETHTPATHITIREAGEESKLSDFMNGTVVQDPRNGANISYDDLGRRIRASDALVCGTDAANSDRDFSD